MALERIDTYFNSVAETYDNRMQRPMTDKDGYIVRTAMAVPRRRNMQLLDLGCGTGLELLPLLERDSELRVSICSIGDLPLVAESRRTSNEASSLLLIPQSEKARNMISRGVSMV